MAYDISTYKTVLDHYLTSGVKYLRYVSKRIGKATIYYPIINDAQIKSYLIDQICKEGTTTYYDKSKPYSDWDWFKSNYDVKLDELDPSLKADYLVIIIGDMSALITLTSENYDVKRLAERKVYDIQAYLLLNASKRIARNGNYFYRYDFRHGRFVYGQKRLPIQQVKKIAQDATYTSDNVFIDYLQQVNVDNVDSLMYKLLDRYIRGCKGTDKSVSKGDWLNHTKSVFDSMKCNSSHQGDIRDKVIQFCEQQMKSAKSATPTNVITAHYSTIKGTVNIGKLYDCLFTEGYIDGQTTKDDFIFYFSGIGSYPSKRIIWKGKKVLLAILIAKLHTSALTDWKTTEAIFEGVKGDNLKKQYNNSKSDSKSETIIEQLISQAK